MPVSSGSTRRILKPQEYNWRYKSTRYQAFCGVCSDLVKWRTVEPVLHQKGGEEQPVFSHEFIRCFRCMAEKWKAICALRRVH